MAVASKTKWFAVEMLGAVLLAGGFCAAVIWGARFLVDGSFNKMLLEWDINRARKDIKILEKAVNAYQLRHGYLPESLQGLTHKGRDGSPAILTNERVLIDPWNNPYIYDPNSRGESKPLIYSNGPPGGQDIHISNWD